MRVGGRIGDTYLVPGKLFDASDPAAAPPAGAIDVQFRVPVSLSLLLESLAGTRWRGEVDAWAAGYRDVVIRLLDRVQSAGGYALVSQDAAAPARLDLAASIESAVAGVGTRWHCHVWVGPTARTVAEGERLPVAVEVLRRRMQSQVWAFYMNEVEDLSARELGVRWGEPRPAAVREIVDPPWHEQVGPGERGVCTSPRSSTGQLILADEEDLRLAAQMEASHRVAVEEGTVYNPDIDPAEARAGLIRGLLSVGRARRAATHQGQQ